MCEKQFVYRLYLSAVSSGDDRAPLTRKWKLLAISRVWAADLGANFKWHLSTRVLLPLWERLPQLASDGHLSIYPSLFYLSVSLVGFRSARSLMFARVLGFGFHRRKLRRAIAARARFAGFASDGSREKRSLPPDDVFKGSQMGMSSSIRVSLSGFVLLLLLETGSLSERNARQQQQQAAARESRHD